MDSSLIKESRISRFETCLGNRYFPKKRKRFFWKLLPGFQDLEGGFMLEGRGLKQSIKPKAALRLYSGCLWRLRRA